MSSFSWVLRPSDLPPGCSNLGAIRDTVGAVESYLRSSRATGALLGTCALVFACATNSAATTQPTVDGGGPALAPTVRTVPVALAVDVAASKHRISPDIYGVNFAAESGLAGVYRVPIDRWGGNATSRYNYSNRTTNVGSDWYFENIVRSGPDTLESFVDGDRRRGSSSLVTVPMLGYVARNSPADHPFLCSFPTSLWRGQTDSDPWDPGCGNGIDARGKIAAVPSRTSLSAGPAFDQAMVSWLVRRYGAAGRGGVRIYGLDNEPALWSEAHRDVHPSPQTYDELTRKSTATAAAVKRADRSAAVLGPSDWGWCAYFFSAAEQCGQNRSDHATHANVDMAPWYLARFRAASAAAGVRLLDYFDEHFYPQGSGIALASAGDADTQARRLRSTRSLWDPTYVDESWIGRDVGAAPIQLIRRMKRWVSAYYPGTKTAITEYNFGGLESINGALTQADALGIFGREGLDLATMWAPPKASQPGAFAFRMYRNYNGRGGAFGETSVRSTTTDQSRLAVYGATRSVDGALTVMVINKSNAAIRAPLAVAHGNYAHGRGYRYSAAARNRIVDTGVVPIVAGKVTTTYPANSMTLVVLTR